MRCNSHKPEYIGLSEICEALPAWGIRQLLSFADPFTVEQMYLNIGTPLEPKYRSLRSSSQLEGFHRHILDIISGANNSPEMARAKILMHLQRWNLLAGIRNRGMKDPGTTDLSPLYEIRQMCQNNGWADPYSELPLLPDLPVKQIVCDETVIARLRAASDGNRLPHSTVFATFRILLYSSSSPCSSQIWTCSFCDACKIYISY